MTTSVDLYFFDPRDEAAQKRRLRAVRDVAADLGLDLQDMLDDGVHHYATLRWRDAPTGFASDRASLTYLREQLDEKRVPPEVSHAVCQILEGFRAHQAKGDVLDVQVGLPGSLNVRLEESRIVLSEDVEVEVVIPYGASHDEAARYDWVQRLEHQPHVRVKFASLDSRQRYVGACTDEMYTAFYDLLELPDGWRHDGSAVLIETRSESTRYARPFLHDNARAAAVEHETGVEILLAVGVSVATGLATDAAKTLVKALWNRWKAARSSAMTSATVFVEVESMEWSPQGQPLRSVRHRLVAPVSDEQLGDLVDSALKPYHEAAGA